MTTDLGTCPTGEHPPSGHRYCGYTGVVDLVALARARRWRVRFEESYAAEHDPHVRGDGRHYAEVPCRRGTVYPYAGDVLVARAPRQQVLGELLAIPGVERHQSGDREGSVRFRVGLLDDVARVLRPKRLPGRADYVPAPRERGDRGRFTGRAEAQAEPDGPGAVR